MDLPFELSYSRPLNYAQDGVYRLISISLQMHVALRVCHHCKGIIMPVITLPDGSQRQFEQPVSVLDVANDIGPGLAKATIAGRVNGQRVDDRHYTLRAWRAVVTYLLRRQEFLYE